MRRLVFSVICLVCCGLRAVAGDIYVSAARGNDSNSGTAAQPLLTVEAALKTAREWRRLASDNIRGGINIIIESGTYRPLKPIYIRPEDSGTADSPTVIRSGGGNGGQAVISGGIRVGNWRKGSTDVRLPENVRGRVWVTESAPMFSGRIVYVRQLWADGRKMTRATQFGFERMQRMIDFNTLDESITIPTPEFTFYNIGQLEMTVHQRWAIALLRVREMKNMGNGQTKVWFQQPESQIEFAHPWPQPVINGERGSSSFCLTNALEMLDEPGEWYQDYPSGLIYFLPEDDNADPNKIDVEIPRLENLVEVGGTRERKVSNISFDNISFQYAAWLRPSLEGHVTLQGGFRFIDGYKLQEPGLFHKKELENQAWIARPEAAVTAQFADSIEFNGCSFEHTGATALDLMYAVSCAKVDNCTFEDIGGTALLGGYFGEGGFETHIPYTPSIGEDLCHDLLITNNRIHDAANEDWGCVAMGLGYVSNVNIAHNQVSRVNYSGICVGWGWTALESGMKNNRIVDNDVSDYARQCYDAGGIYTLSNQPGSLIENNRISPPADAPCATNHRAFCIYFDEATDGYTVRGNSMVKGSYGYNKQGENLIVVDNK